MGYLASVIKWLWEGVRETFSIYKPVQAPVPIQPPVMPIQPTNTPTEAPSAPQTPSTDYLTTILPWTSQKNNYHNVGVVCDRVGLTPNQKLIVRGCVMQESRFWNILPNGQPVKNINHFKDGSHSTDWGITQVNDYWNIGSGKPYPSVQYVLDNPEVCVEDMAKEMKRTGQLKRWASYTSGAYLQWIRAGSQMYTLAS